MIRVDVLLLNMAGVDCADTSMKQVKFLHVG